MNESSKSYHSKKFKSLADSFFGEETVTGPKLERFISFSDGCRVFFFDGLDEDFDLGAIFEEIW